MALIFHSDKQKTMADKQDSRNTPYAGERNTEPHKETGDINFRNNNAEATSPNANEPNVEGAGNEGIGDSALNDKKLTNFTSNHSQDA